VNNLTTTGLLTHCGILSNILRSSFLPAAHRTLCLKRLHIASASGFLAPLGCYAEMFANSYPVYEITLVSRMSFKNASVRVVEQCHTVTDQVSHPYKTTGKITVLYILIFIFWDSRREDKRFWTEWQQALLEFNLLLISSWIRLSFVIVPKYLNCATFSNHTLPVFMSWFCPAFWWWDSDLYLVFTVFSWSVMWKTTLMIPNNFIYVQSIW
jgi:hypothetical protein